MNVSRVQRFERGFRFRRPRGRAKGGGGASPDFVSIASIQHGQLCNKMRAFMRSSCRVSNYSWNLVELESRPELGAVQVVQPTTPTMASPAAKFAFK